MTDNNKMLEFAEAEVRRLRAELEKTPAFKRLKAAENLIAEYRGNPEVDVVVKTADHTTLVQTKTSRSSLMADARDMVASIVEPMVERHKTKTAMVEAAAEEYLMKKGRRATSGELLPVVQAKGIHVTGKTPSKTISSYLSTSKRFDNVPGFGGYGLIEWNGRRTAPQQPADAESGTPAGTTGLFN